MAGMPGPLDTATVVGFVPTADVARARDFYQRCLGLTLGVETPQFVVFETAGTELRVNLVEHHSPVPFTIAGWQVPDIAATVGALVAAGVVFSRYDFMDQDELGIWTTPGGDQVAWFTDPDGNVLSLQQLPG
jgi:catechol 2,3-dioxygenase-like lactoylglutathione lyase family enzyme